MPQNLPPRRGAPTPLGVAIVEALAAVAMALCAGAVAYVAAMWAMY